MTKKVKKVKKPVVQPAVQPTRLFLEYDTTREGGERLTDERWSDRSDEVITVDFIRFHRSQPSHRFFYDSVELNDQMAEFDKTNPFEKLYLAVVRYSTGDTFGRTTGSWHIVGVAPTYKVAQAMLDEATKPAKRGDYKNYKPWEGYFEHLEGTEIHTLEVV